MWEGARIGGQGDAAKVKKHDREALRAPLEQIAQQRQRNWSLPLAMLSWPKLGCEI